MNKFMKKFLFRVGISILIAMIVGFMLYYYTEDFKMAIIVMASIYISGVLGFLIKSTIHELSIID